MKHSKNASPREWYEDGMVSFIVENLPKLEFGKIVIYSGNQSNITTEEFFNQVSQNKDGSLNTTRKIKLNKDRIDAIEVNTEFKRREGNLHLVS